MLTRETAEIVGLKALAWLAGSEDLLPVFLGSSGASAADLKERASDPDFLASVLDFVLLDDEWVLAFCRAAELEPEMPRQARALLPGGAEVNWT